MKKTVISLLLAAVIMACGVIGASAAAPVEFASDCSGKSSDVIYVKRPEKLYDTTTDSTYTISATAKEGTQITVYKKNPLDGKYRQIYFEEGKLNTTKVGASGLYSVSLNLSDGANNFLLYAEGEVLEVQIVKVDITKSELRLVDKIIQLTMRSANPELSPLA
jgi:hypothetical protein